MNSHNQNQYYKQIAQVLEDKFKREAKPDVIERVIEESGDEEIVLEGELSSNYLT